MKYTITNYPDKSSYVTIDDTRGDLIFRINSYTDLWTLNQIIDAYNSTRRSGARGKLKVTIPCLFDAQADRRFDTNQSSGLKLVCEFLNSMPALFNIFHPHNPEVVEALMSNVTIIDNTSFINSVCDEIMPLEEQKDNLILMSTDAGGYKPLMKLCDNIPWRGETYSASKSRKYDEKLKKSIITQLVDREDFNGKDILLIDDLSIGGGTFKGLATLLKQRNVDKLYLAVSHMTVQDLGTDPVTNYFDKVFTTNSKYNEYFDRFAGENPKNLEVINLFDI